jgi:undecaprenyl-diphosphatase
MKNAMTPSATTNATAVATVVAFFVALGVIAFFMSYISKRSFLPFVIYRVALGTLLLVLLSLGVISAY